MQEFALEDRPLTNYILDTVFKGDKSRAFRPEIVALMEKEANYPRNKGWGVAKKKDKDKTLLNLWLIARAVAPEFKDKVILLAESLYEGGQKVRTQR